MNTQRPEWNDANNALVGFGLSMVTLAHLRRYLQMLDEITGDLDDTHLVSADVVAWLDRIASILESHERVIGTSSIDDGDRSQIVGELGQAFDDYRTRLYESGPSVPERLTPDALRRLLRISIRHLDDSLRAAHRPDGLYDAYNLVAFSEAGAEASVSRLAPMLEGQVAAISSGLLDADEVVALVEAMYDSELYRDDVDSFVLYPAHRRPPFLERNHVPVDAVESNPLLSALLAAGNDHIIVRDVSGKHHFNADFTNAADLATTLDITHRDRIRVAGQRARRRERSSCSNRSSTTTNSPGDPRRCTHTRGSGRCTGTWWPSCCWRYRSRSWTRHREPMTMCCAQLTRLYDRVRHGLGFNKTAAEYGAFPTDPYSHTPAHAGAQQPGMTGQVKEELLARWAELGLTVSRGSIRFSPALLEHPRVPNRARHAELPRRRRSSGRSPGPIRRRGLHGLSHARHRARRGHRAADRDHQQRRHSERGRRIDPRPGDLQRDLRSHRAHRAARRVHPTPNDSAVGPTDRDAAVGDLWGLGSTPLSASLCLYATARSELAVDVAGYSVDNRAREPLRIS